MIGILICMGMMLLLQILTPFWWWVAAVPFLYGSIRARSLGKEILTGACSAGFLWFGAALYFYITQSQLIASRMASMLGLGISWLMIPAAALAAAIAGGVSGGAGYFFRHLLVKKQGRSPAE